MAGAQDEFKAAPDNSDDDETASLKTPRQNGGLLPDHPSPLAAKPHDAHSDDPPLAPQRRPSLSRRMSSQLLLQADRQRSIADNIGITDRMNQYVPDAIRQQIPGLQRRNSALRRTYLCYICYSKKPVEEGFRLSTCGHLFCRECIQGFLENKIINGQVAPRCFYLENDEKACGQPIAEEDIMQIVSETVWKKYEKFKANQGNANSRQCPFCDHTQTGDPEHPMMVCDKCGREYCFTHSNAHDSSMTCEEYELSVAKETKMNEMALHQMGDNVKPCPQCKFMIIKNGGCNHMKCVKCQCSFCWLCMEIIEDEELPLHYKDPTSGCHGKQFEGMESPPVNRGLMCVLAMCSLLFCIPSAILGIVFGALCFPLVCCCGCTTDNGRECTLWDSMLFSGLIWMLIFIAIPLCILFIIWRFLVSLYDVIRICLPCLPPSDSCLGDGGDQQVGGGEAPPAGPVVNRDGYESVV